MSEISDNKQFSLQEVIDITANLIGAKPQDLIEKIEDNDLSNVDSVNSFLKPFLVKKFNEIREESLNKGFRQASKKTERLWSEIFNQDITGKKLDDIFMETKDMLSNKADKSKNITIQQALNSSEVREYIESLKSKAEQVDKVQQIVTQLKIYFNTEILLYTVPHGKILTEIGRVCNRKMACVLCRRMMFKTASELGRSKDLDFLVTGESLGQVASQTLKNIRSENPASNLFIIRPLISLDKIEIESLAKKYGTYAISILPGTCCSMAPKYPVTYSNPNQVKTEENKLNLLDLVEKARKNTKIT